MVTESSKYRSVGVYLEYILKLIVLVFLLAPIIRCSDSNITIEGKWTHIKTIKNGFEVSRHTAMENDLEQIQYLKNGEMIYLLNGGRYGFGYYYYKIKGDSLFQTIIQVDSIGAYDTLGTIKVKFSINNDTMRVWQREKTILYKRDQKTTNSQIEMCR